MASSGYRSELEAESERIHSIALSADGTIIATGTIHNTIRYWGMGLLLTWYAVCFLLRLLRHSCIRRRGMSTLTNADLLLFHEVSQDLGQGHGAVQLHPCGPHQLDQRHCIHL
jgi:hypothetical protein